MGEGRGGGEGGGEGDVVSLHEVSVREQVKASLEACEAVLGKAEEEVGGVVEGLLGLRDEVAEVGVRAGVDVLGGGGSSGVVREAVEKARKEVEGVMSGLTWWRAVSRVDEVGEVVRGAVDRAWCRELEDKVRSVVYIPPV